MFLCFWLCWVFLAAHGLSLAVVSGGHSLAAGAGFSWLAAEHRLQEHRLQSLQHSGSVVGAHGFSCCMACGIFPDQGSNLHWQVDSCPLHHQGSPHCSFDFNFSNNEWCRAFFSCASWPSVCLLWRNVYLDLPPSY